LIIPTVLTRKAGHMTGLSSFLLQNHLAACGAPLAALPLPMGEGIRAGFYPKILFSCSCTLMKVVRLVSSLSAEAPT